MVHRVHEYIVEMGVGGVEASSLQVLIAAQSNVGNEDAGFNTADQGKEERVVLICSLSIVRSQAKKSLRHTYQHTNTNTVDG